MKILRRFSLVYCLIAGALCLGLSSCALLNYRKGLVVGEVVGGRTRHLDEYIQINDPPLAVQVKGNPPSNVLAVSPPILPLPVFPWPPGIFDVFAHKEKYQLPDDNLKIGVYFNRRYVDRIPYPTEFIFSPSDVRLTIGGMTFNPIGVVLNCGEALGNRCQKRSDGRYSIAVNSGGMPGCVLTFDIRVSRLEQASLHIDNLVYLSTNQSLELLVKRGPKIRMGYIGP